MWACIGRPHSLGNLASVLGAKSGLGDYIGWLGANFDPSIRWTDLDWMREAWDGPLIIKGILDPEDARAAARFGADGIVVSNHGGRQLDGVLSIGAGVAGDRRCGERQADDPCRFRRAIRLDVVRTDGVGRGRRDARSRLGVRAGGERRRRRQQLLEIFAKEMRVAMALTSVCKVGEIDRSILA